MSSLVLTFAIHHRLHHGYHFDVDGLNEYFGQFGKMIDSVVMKDGAGKSRGFAFVTYEDPAVVRAVMAKESHVIDNKQVTLHFVS